jgi:CheY-like chemotaxis protein
MNQAAVLYVEDEENDIIFMQMAFTQLGLGHLLKIAVNGEEAINYLGGMGPFADRRQFPLPGLVLLDLNLPRVPGMKVLEWIRRQPQFSGLPVVVYTSSDQPSDRERAEGLGASDFIVKPTSFEGITVVVKGLVTRWLEAARTKYEG